MTTAPETAPRPPLVDRLRDVAEHLGTAAVLPYTSPDTPDVGDVTRLLLEAAQELEARRVPPTLEQAHAIVHTFTAAAVASIMGETAVTPTASLLDAAEALRVVETAPSERRQRPDGSWYTSIRVRPDPRLVAALVACRDYEPEEPQEPEAIIHLPDGPDHVRALYCIRQRVRKDGDEAENEE